MTGWQRNRADSSGPGPTSSSTGSRPTSKASCSGCGDARAGHALNIEVPAVDVVIVSWNVRTELLGCVESVLGSSSVDVRLVVVDNASTDGSVEAVAAI